MEWSQKFVPFFGGNVDDALLSGCSAGGESVWWHLTHSGRFTESILNSSLIRVIIVN